MPVSEGDDALGGVAHEVRGGALVVLVGARPAVPASPVVRAIGLLMSCILAVTFEAVDVAGENAFSLP